MKNCLAEVRAKLIDYVVLDDGPGLKSTQTRERKLTKGLQCKQSRKDLTVLEL
jgi:hypothetical protein